MTFIRCIVSDVIAPKDKLILALDVQDANAADDLAGKVAPHVGLLKVGLELFTRCGPEVVANLKTRHGLGIFLDLKFHDIPNTVTGAVRSACALGVDMLTIHLAGGPDMINAAVRAAAGTNTKILGVTVLTSSDLSTLDAVGVKAAAVEDQVLRLAKIGLEAGINGIVASPLEVSLLRQVFGSTFEIVTPGIRPAGSHAGDQKRIMTPRQAVEAGASRLVIGRPVSAAPDPAAAAKAILNSISDASARAFTPSNPS